MPSSGRGTSRTEFGADADKSFLARSSFAIAIESSSAIDYSTDFALLSCRSCQIPQVPKSPRLYLLLITYYLLLITCPQVPKSPRLYLLLITYYLLLITCPQVPKSPRLYLLLITYYLLLAPKSPTTPVNLFLTD